MKELKLVDGTKISLYESIKEMPIMLHNMAQSYFVQESGIGSDMASFDGHFANFDALLSAGRYEDALNEKNNLRFNFFVMLNKLDFKSMAFSCYIHSVDGDVIELDDRNEGSMKNLIEMLSKKGLTMDMVDDQLVDLKKNFNPN